MSNLYSTKLWRADVHNYLQSLSDYNNFIIIGDLNYPDINWNNLSASTPISSSFCDIVFSLNLTQHVIKSTHLNGNILDVVLSNCDLVDEPRIIDKLVPVGLSSDHYMIHFAIPAKAHVTAPTTSKVFFKYSKADRITYSMNSFLSNYDFSPIYDSCDIEFIWFYLKQAIHFALENYVPKVVSRQHQHPVWFNSGIKHELNRIHTMRRKCQLHPTPNNKSKLTTAEAHLQLRMSNAKMDYESALINNFAFSNNSKIFNYVSSLSKNNQSPTAMYYNGHCSSDSFEKAQMFNKYFYSVFTRTSSPYRTIFENSKPDKLLRTINIHYTEVFEALVSLDSSKAMGIDRISPKILKNCATSLCEPITFLYIQCLWFGYLPQEWRTHCITPIYKSGDKAIVSNYRPISLLCIISKILEKIVYKHTISFLSDYFTKHQFGFIPGHSSLQQLLLYINNLITAKEDSCQVDTIYVDFKKAFDTVPHATLLNKLQDYGITGDVFNFYKAYLSNRLQCVNINEILSDFLPVLSGVPQGSLLGPLLFVVYVNDMPNVFLHTIPFMFADDTKCLKNQRTS